jgi:NAD(P)H-dependent flavin oxidoreductase YrpB (nitropropane dioxygenase family)
MRTRLTDLLEIEHPVMLAGMGGVSYHRLVAAVSEAGGAGTFGAATMRPEQLAEEIALARQATSKPFGVDLLAAMPGQIEAGIRHVVEGGARFFVAGLGIPRDVIDQLHAHNVLVGSMCGKVRHAIGAVESGCDFVVAQGRGRHRRQPRVHGEDVPRGAYRVDQSLRCTSRGTGALPGAGDRCRPRRRGTPRRTRWHRGGRQP